MSEKEKNQLHQLLAVEPSLKANAKNIFYDEAKTTFEKKQDHFDGVVKVYTPLEEDGDQIPDEVKELVTTVSDKMRYAQDAVIRAVDAEVSKEETNCSGDVRADLLIGSKTYQLSATSLLVLEKYLESIRGVYKAIPTLDPTKVWNNDTKAGNNRYTTEGEVKFRTVKRIIPITVAPATDKHPAQVQMINKDIQAGKYLTTYKSGRITPSQKSALLSKIDALLVNVKKARAKANQAAVVNMSVGKEIFDYINKDII